MGGGAVVAALGLGLVLTNRASNVINFAHAATGTFLAYAYFEFRDRGDLVLPVLGLPDRIRIIPTPTIGTAIVVLALYAAALGVVIHLLVFRPLRSASVLARIVASLGLFLYFQELIRNRFPTAGAAVITRFPVLPDGPVEILGVGVSANRLWLALVVVVVAAALAATFRWTRFGLVTRASAESDKGALLIGLRPDLVAAANWALATVLAGFAVVLIEPIAGLDGATTSLLVVPALAAALVGRLTSFAWTAAAGLGIGVVQSLILGWTVQPEADWLPDWLPAAGLQQVIPVVVILAALTLRGDVLPGRGAIVDRAPKPAPTPGRWWPIGPVVLATVGVLGALVLDAGDRRGLVVSLAFSVLGLSVVVICGYAGRISLAQLALAGISGFTVVHVADGSVPFPFDLLAGALVATAVGVAIGAATSRLRGMTFAVATLAIAVALEQLVLASPWLSGGAAGLTAPRPSLFGIDLGAQSSGVDDVRPAFVVMVAVVVALCFAGVLALRRSELGLRWLALRANERAAAAGGVDVGRARLVAFGVSAALAGVSGALSAYSTSTLSPASFTVFGSLVVVALVFLGGVSTAWGAVVAALIVQGGLLTSLGSGDGVPHLYAWAGVALVLAANFAPEGILGLARAARDRFGRARSTDGADAPGGGGGAGRGASRGDGATAAAGAGSAS
ncbi:ABC transporter permease [Dermatobacter hominis]|uniref:ABC transporter permease n=1 Tax=Dermatobacter hominis TaxID=2884263 RepID=UPI001D12F784|nr:ABC transporter permease [Dermatobacter hominis]UDY37946.1 ABC transporter permease [Dermatobacter hominis]